jgi:hypothetical protein
MLDGNTVIVSEKIYIHHRLSYLTASCLVIQFFSALVDRAYSSIARAVIKLRGDISPPTKLHPSTGTQISALFEN